MKSTKTVSRIAQRKSSGGVSRPVERAAWTFLTNHAHVLLCLAHDPGARLRDVAELVGVTERAVQRIVADLEGAGYLQRERSGRRNVYQVDDALPLRHALESHRPVAALLALGLSGGAGRTSRRG